MLHNYLNNVLTFLVLNFIAIALPGQYPFADITIQSPFNELKGFYGISVGDFNNDRYEDIVVSFLNKNPRIYLNQKNNSYKDVTNEMGLDHSLNARTAIWIDIDNNGWLDLIIGGRNDNNQLFLNDKGTKFTNVSEEFGINTSSNTFSLNVSELNSDPYLDIYMSNFLQENELFLNEGNNEVSNRINYYQLWDNGKSMASIFFDYDNDGDDDLYLVHDGNQPNILFQRNSDNYFLDVSVMSKSDIAANGMGVDIGDINNDGCMDMYITNLYENNLLLNNCDGTFSDISITAGVADFGMGWGTTFLDYNNDGNIDILVCNDTYFSDYPNVLFQNNGDLTFSKIDLPLIDGKTASYGCVWTDIDLDGKVDIAIANQNDKDNFQLLHNIDENDNGWIGFYLEGVVCNRQAVGSRIEILDSEGQLHTDQVTGGNGYASQGSPLLHFGLGKATINTIKIIWTDGQEQEISVPQVNSYYFLRQGNDPELMNSTTATSDLLSHYSDVNIYPNPANTQFTISINKETVENGELVLTDVLGREIWRTSWVPDVNGKQLVHVPTIEKLNQSYYFVSIYSDKKVITKKLFLKN